MHPPRIMYVENKSAQPPGSRGVWGPARIGRVTFSRTGKSICYGRKILVRVKGYKYNCIDAETGDRYWISGPRRDGADGLYGPRPTPIDADVREEYWTVIRRLPNNKHRETT